MVADKAAAARLKEARKGAGFPTATAAADALGINPATYLAHENGSRGFRAEADRYARRYGRSLEWLVTGRGPRERRTTAAPDENTVPLVGYVSAGAAHFFTGDQGELDRVPAPKGSLDTTVAVEIRGDSLGSFFDRWLVFYDDVRRPVTPDLLGDLCVVGLDDGRVLIKRLKRSKTRGLFHLLSQTEDPIFDVTVEWAARVRHMSPR